MRPPRALQGFQIRLRHLHPGFQSRERGAQVAPGPVGEPVEDLCGFRCLAPFPGPGPPQHLLNMDWFQGLQGDELAAAAQRRIQVEGRILRGGADEDGLAALEVGQEDVLLGPVEAVDLIQEHHGRHGAKQGHLAAVGQELLQFRRAAADAGELHEAVARGFREDAGQGGLARARRPPHHHGGQAPTGREPRQGPPGSEKMRLAHHLVEGGRAEAFGQGHVGHGSLSSLSARLC